MSKSKPKATEADAVVRAWVGASTDETPAPASLRMRMAALLALPATQRPKGSTDRAEDLAAMEALAPLEAWESAKSGRKALRLPQRGVITPRRASGVAYASSGQVATVAAPELVTACVTADESGVIFEFDATIARATLYSDGEVVAAYERPPEIDDLSVYVGAQPIVEDTSIDSTAWRFRGEALFWELEVDP